MYLPKARAMRRCKAIKVNGEQCKGYAKLDGSLCTLHSYNHRRKLPKKGAERRAAKHRRAKIRAMPQRRFICQCPAYAFPHKLNSGICRFPDVEQKYRDGEVEAVTSEERKEVERQIEERRMDRCVHQKMEEEELTPYQRQVSQLWRTT